MHALQIDLKKARGPGRRAAGAGVAAPSFPAVSVGVLLLAAVACAGPAEGSRSGDAERAPAGGAAGAPAGAPAGAAAVTAAVVLVDDVGETVRLPRPAGRVVSLVPSVTGLLLRLGAGDRLIGRTRYDTAAWLADVPSVGEPTTPSLERLASLRPDLVIAWDHMREASPGAALERLGVPVYHARLVSLGDVRRTIGRLGSLMGLEARADCVAAALDAELADVRRSVRDRSPVRVFYVVYPRPPSTVGRGTYLAEVLELAGAVNVFGDVGSEWPQVSLEQAFVREPDVVVVARQGSGPGAYFIRSAPGWRTLPAVREGRVVEVDADVFHRPDRVAEAARRLAAALHPEATVTSAEPGGRRCG